MARKSRRNKNVEAVSNQIIENCENLIDTGAYIRLSVENGGNETDETLVVQQMLVEKFIEEHPDLKLAGTYIDNGFSREEAIAKTSEKLGMDPEEMLDALKTYLIKNKKVRKTQNEEYILGD